MKVRPGPNAYRGVVLIAPVVLLAGWWPPLLILAALSLGAGVALGWRDHREVDRTLRGLSLSRDVPPVVGRGAAVTMRLQIHSTLPARGVWRDVLPDHCQPQHRVGDLNATPDRAQDIETSVVFPNRGRYTFDVLWVRLRGPRGLVERQTALPCPGEVRVLPESLVTTDALQKQFGQTILQDLQTRTQWRGDGLEFESLSDYRPGDDPRRVDWRTSARRRRLVVRRYQLEQHRDVVLLIDCGRLMSASDGKGTKLDRAVDAALLLGRTALTRGDRCGAGIFAHQVRGFLPPVAGRSAFDVLMNQIYNVQPVLEETNFTPMFATLQRRHVKRSLIVVLSDLIDVDTTLRYRSGLVSLAHRHVVLFVALRTPRLEAYTRQQAEASLDVAETAVALRLMREREKALHALRRAGVFVLDVEPREVTVPLINRYIALRERNLL